MLARQYVRTDCRELLRFPGWKRYLNMQMNANKTSSVNPQSSASQQIYCGLDSDAKEIRLLRLEPGIDNDPIQCHLEPARLFDNKAPPYETVSYVWGDMIKRRSIIVNGHPMDVHESAEIALRRLRFLQRPRSLWIDAVCINQDDVTECSQQVALMHYVYRLGDFNTIWLGDDEDVKIKDALDSIRSVLRDMMKETDWFRYVAETM